MAAQSLVISCTSTPHVLVGSIGSSSYHGAIRCRLKALTGISYLGDSGVTTAGYPLTTGDGSIDLVVLVGETLWCASSSGASATLGVLRLNETT
jgi:hypothetical protein